MKFNSLLRLSFLLTPVFAAQGPARSGQAMSQSRPPIVQKYFQEPGGSIDLWHYDARYFKGKTVSYDERRDALRHLVRSYLSTFREYEIETWIAHGTLLGWWWNGQVLPWDFDLDSQVSATTLTWLGENLNMTMHNYTATGSDGKAFHRQYLLDINPNHVDRARGNGMNVIDGRWIDVRNGLFIDITGLSETDPARKPGIWSCKNMHHYKTRDIYPLRETIFEGVPALVPYEFSDILTKEYSPMALKKTEHAGHKWIASQKEWIRNIPQRHSNNNNKNNNQAPSNLGSSNIPKPLPASKPNGFVQKTEKKPAGGEQKSGSSDGKTNGVSNKSPSVVPPVGIAGGQKGASGNGAAPAGLNTPSVASQTRRVERERNMGAAGEEKKVALRKS